MSLEITRQELLKQAIYLNKLYATTRNQEYKDQETRIRRIIVELDALTIGTSNVATLNDLTDVTISAPANAQVLTYNSTTLQWENQTPAAGGGGDMSKSTYDVDNDGVVDSAETTQIIVRNSTGSTLTKGQVVYLSGATGNRPNAILSQAHTEATSSKTIGIVVANIANNSDGYVAVNGTLHNLDTSAFADGVAVWLSATTAGGMTSTIPAEPNHTVFIGYIARAHPNQGRLVIAIQNGYELNELHGVLIASEANNDLLVYESSTSLWKNKTFSAIFGGTPLVSVPTLDQVTTAGNTTTNAITVGKLNVVNTSTTIAPVIISGTNPWTGGSGADYFVINGTGNVGTTLKTDVGGYVAHRFFGNNVELGVFYCGEANKEFVFKNSSTGYIDFQTTAGANSRLRIFNNGNVAINTTTDAGYKLDVNGTARLSGELFSGIYIGTQTSRVKLKGVTAGTNTAYYLVGEHGSNGQEQFYIREDGSSSFQNIITKGTLFVDSIEPRTSSTTLQLKSFSGATYGVALQNGFDFVHTTGQRSLFRLGQGFAPTSGTGIYNTIILDNIINQTGGANGITRGIYINPTLTAAADFRAIEASGRIFSLYNAAFDTSAANSNFVLQHSNGSQAGIGITSDGAMRVKAPGGSPFVIVSGSVQTWFNRYNHSSIQAFSGDFGIYGSGDVQKFRIFNSTGNVLIQNGGTFTDSGNKLQVTGTGYFSNAVQIGSGNNVPAGSNALTVVGYGSYTFNFNNSTGFTMPNVQLLSDYLRLGGGGVKFIGNNSFGGAGNDLFLHAGYAAGNVNHNKVRIGTAFSSGIGREFAVFDMELMCLTLGTTTSNTSSILQVDSTTKGFLQPRMTNTQALAIATPATGLQAYDTTNNKNLLYNGTVWQNIATESWVSAQGYLTSTPTLAQVTTAGNTTTNAITVGGLTSNGSVTAASLLARGVFFNNTLVAAANNDVLVGLDIQPAFTNGAFTGVSNVALRVKGAGATSATTALLVQNSTPADIFTIANDGSALFDLITSGSAVVIRRTATPTSRLIQFLSSGGARFYTYDQEASPNANGDDGAWLFKGRHRRGANSGIASAFRIEPFFAQEQFDTIQLNSIHIVPNIFISGTATNVTVRGIYYNPTIVSLTGVVAHRAIETTSGNIVFNGGNVLIGTSTDAGEKLQVVGDIRISNGRYKLGGAQVGLYATSDLGLTVNTGSGNSFLGYYSTGDTSYAGTTVTLGRLSSVDLNVTSGLQEMVRVTGNYAPTSGTGLFTALQLSNTINQTGGANGITRGIYINPTLTAAADFRSIEWSNNSGWGLYGAGTSNNYLGGRLSIATTNTPRRLNIEQANGSTAASIGLYQGGGLVSVLGVDAANTNDLQIASTQSIRFYASSTIGNIATEPTNERMRLFSNGNLAINTTTDAGYKLDVNGTARVVAQTYYGTFSESPTIYSSDTGGGYLASAASLTFALRNGAGGSGRFIFTSPAKNSTTAGGFQYLTQYFATFDPTSSSTNYTMIEVAPTINQTGGANGVTRGIHVNPTLTAAADFRAIETTVGNVIFGSTSGNVGIGTVAPSQKLDVVGIIKSSYILTPFIYTTGSDTLTLATQGGTSAVTIFPTTRNVLIQNGGTHVDAGYKLDVNGTARVQGDLYLGSTTNVFQINKRGGTTASSYLTLLQDGNNRTFTFYQRASIFGAAVDVGMEVGAGFLTLPYYQALIGAATTTSNAKLISTGSITASTALAHGVYFNNTLVAAANNDVLVGLDINPTFTNGAFTGVSNVALRVKGAGATSATTSLLVQNSSSTNLLKVTDDGKVIVEGVFETGTTNGFTFNSNTISTRVNGFLTLDRTSNRNFSFSDAGGTRVYLNIQSDSVSNFADVSINTNHLVVKKGGNVLIGTTTDAGQKLQVIGSVFIKGADSLSSTKVFEVQNGAGASIMDFRNATYAFFGCGQGGGSNSGFIFNYSNTSYTQFAGYNYGAGAGSYKPILMDTDTGGRNQGIFVNFGVTTNTPPNSDTEFGVLGRTSDSTTYISRFRNSGNTDKFAIRADGALFTNTLQGYSGTLNIPTNPPGSTNITITNGIITNVA